MAPSTTNRKAGIRGFLILLTVVFLGAVVLRQSGYLDLPLENTLMAVSLASGSDNFTMIGPGRTPPGAAISASSGDSLATANEDDEDENEHEEEDEEDDDENVVVAQTSGPASNIAQTTGSVSNVAQPAGTMTVEQLTAELSAAGVDVNSLSAKLAAQGRGLDSLLAVINSGRTTVSALAARLNAESGVTAPQAPAPAEGRESNDDSELTGVQWDEFGSVIYDLWFILAVITAVIVLARPIGWLVNRYKPARRPVTD